MRIIYFGRKNSEADIEEIVFTSIIALFILMAIVQYLLTLPSIRETLCLDPFVHADRMPKEVFAYDSGRIGLVLKSRWVDSNVKVLVNGKEKVDFSKNKVEIEVNDGDVVEIDGSSVPYPVEVFIDSKSENVLNDCINLSVETSSDIKALLRVRLR